MRQTVLLGLLVACAHAAPPVQPVVVLASQAPEFTQGALVATAIPPHPTGRPQPVGLVWPPADETTVEYLVRVNGAVAMRVEAASTRVNLPNTPLEPGPTIEVVAVDAEGNESGALTTSDVFAPVFPSGGMLVDDDGRLSWPEATDDVGVVAYSIRNAEGEVARVEASTRSHALPSPSDYHVAAIDGAGHETELVVRAGVLAILGSMGDNSVADVLRAGATDEVLGSRPHVHAADVLREAAVTTSPGSTLIPNAQSSAQEALEGRVWVQSATESGGTGTFDIRLVSQLVRRRQRALERCYERLLHENPTLAGHIVVAFSVIENGTVRGARANSNTSGSPALASCLINTIRRFRFNPGPDGGDANYLFNFGFAPRP